MRLIECRDVRKLMQVIQFLSKATDINHRDLSFNSCCFICGRQQRSDICSLFILLHVLRSSENDLTFHFFGTESDSIKVREAINRMVEKGRIGNFSLVSTHYALHQEPGLVLQVRFIPLPFQLIFFFFSPFTCVCFTSVKIFLLFHFFLGY